MKYKYLYSYNNGDWKKARKELEKYLKENPNSHYEMALLASVYREMGDVEKAMFMIADAYKIVTTCPTVLWYFGAISEAYGRDDWARTTWRHLLHLGKSGLGKSICKMEEEEVLSILNDSRYRLYLSYKEEGGSLAKRYLTLYNKYLKKGIKSMYE